MEELASRKVKPQLVGPPSPALPVEGYVSCLVRSVTTEAHLAYARAGLHSNNTAELSSVVGVLSCLGPNGPVARDSQACFF